MEEITNKVAQSSLVSFDLEDYYTEGKRIGIDLAQFYNSDDILREKEFRETLKKVDWSVYQEALIYVYDSRENILPGWAFPLLTIYLSPFARHISLGNQEELERELYREKLATLDYSIYKNQKVIIKGCSKKKVPEGAYLYVIQKLQPVVSSLMYGEACSSVPLYKRKNPSELPG